MHENAKKSLAYLTPQGQFAEFIKKRYLDNYAEKAQMQILRVSPTEALSEYKVAGQAGLLDEHTLSRITKGNTGLSIVSYAIRAQVAKEEKAYGLKVMEKSEVVNLMVK